MNETRKLELLRNAFLDLSENDVRALGQAAASGDYPAGAFLCREGESGTTLFVLGEGAADIIVKADEVNDILVDTITAVAYFGEMAFLGETTRMATVRARTSCSVLEIDQADFMSIARANPSLLRTLLRQIIGHLRKNDQAVIRELNIKNAALQRTYADLAEQEALRTQFIATLSHELRTPLTSAKGFLGLIQQGAIQGDSLPAAVESVVRNVDKVVGLTNDLLILYEMHPGETEYASLNVADVLIEALHGAKEAAQGQLPLVQIDIPPDLPEIIADKRGLTLAIRAIIENAFKYDPEGRPVSIRASAGEGSEISLAIRDEGIGISAAAQARIFEPFFRIETEGGQHLFPGLGIGLTIAKFIVGRHNGRIQVESQLNKGSTFTIVLPRQRPLPEG